MRKFVIAIAVLAIIGAFTLRWQPAGTATVFRDGARITTRMTPVYVRASGVPCRIRKAGDALAFENDIAADPVNVHVRFTYTPPDTVPGDWPSGDWCQSLAARVASAVSIPASIGNLREAGDRIAAGIEQKLPGVHGVSARVDVPPAFERLQPIAEVASRAHAAKPVIFIGLDGADWQILDDYIAAGAMPNLQKLVTRGTRGPLQTELPPLSPIVWTTMMTGVSPLEHQILDFTRFNPTTHEKEPITSDERRAPAIWNMLTYAGKEAAVFGLWATYAAEPVRAINVSDRLFTFLYAEAERPPGVVYPPVRQRWAEQRVADAERAIDLAKMREYLPSLTEAEFAALAKSQNPYAEPAAALRRILVETEIYRRLSLDYLRTRLPDLTIVYFQGTDTIGHEFAPFAPPKQPQISQSDFDRYGGVPKTYFAYIDSIIGELSQFDATIVIASDHGFRWKEGRPTEISSTATATAAKWHRNEGIFVVAGGAPPPSAAHSIRDICNVLLDLTGTPRMDYTKYFQRAPSPPPPKTSSNEELAKLRALGYIGSNEATRSAVPQTETKTAGAYNNEGLILRNDKKVDAAIAAFEHALTIDPRYASAMWNLSETLFDANRDIDRADRLLLSALQNGLADGPRFVITRSIAYQRSSRADRALRLLEGAVAAQPNDAELHMFRGRYRMDRHDCAGALQDFIAAEQQQPQNALAFASAGLAQMCLGDEHAARASLARAKELDPTLPLPR